MTASPMLESFVEFRGPQLSLLLPVSTEGSTPAYQCVGDRILHTICCSRTMDLGLHIAVHARKKSFLRHTDVTGTLNSKIVPKAQLPSVHGTAIFHSPRRWDSQGDNPVDRSWLRENRRNL